MQHTAHHAEIINYEMLTHYLCKMQTLSFFHKAATTTLTDLTFFITFAFICVISLLPFIDYKVNICFCFNGLIDGHGFYRICASDVKSFSDITLNSYKISNSLTPAVLPSFVRLSLRSSGRITIGPVPQAY